jgi:hypothetical protein
MTTPVTAPTYDYSRCSRATLEKLAALTEGLPITGPVVDQIRAEARVKTLQDYDAEIGALLRSRHQSNWGLSAADYDVLRKLIEESRGAK